MPLDVEKQLGNWCGVGQNFAPNKLDLKSVDSDKMRKGIINALKHIVSVSNSNLLRNADGFLCREGVSDRSVEWLHGVKCSIPEKFKFSY